MKRQGHAKPAKRRITLTLPAETLCKAQQIARRRNVTVSWLVAEALKETFRVDATAQRSEEILKAFQQPFAGLSDEEMMVLDGIILEPTPARRA